MNHILDNIRKIETEALAYTLNRRQYQVMRELGTAPADAMLDLLQIMDNSETDYIRTVRSLSPEEPEQMLRFIKAVKAVGAIEAIGRMKESGDFSTFVNIRLTEWANRIAMETHDDKVD